MSARVASGTVAGPRFRWVLLAVAGVCAYEVVMVARPWGEVAMTAFRLAAFSVVSAVAAVACVRRGHFEHGRHRRAWLTLSAALGLNAVILVVIAYTFYLDPGRDLAELPVPRQYFLVPHVLTWAGLLMLLERATVPSRLLLALDSLIMGGACLVLGWTVLLGPLTYPSTLPGISLMVYHAGNVVLMAILLNVAVRWQGDRRTLALLVLAFASLSYSTLLTSRNPGGLWRLDGPLNFGSVVGYLLFAAAAAVRPARAGEAAAVGRRRRWPLALVLPYLSVVAVAVTAAVVLATGRSFDRVLAWLVGIFGVLVLARLLLTLLENRRITLDLEQRVVDRTQELHESTRRFRSLVQNSSDIIAVVDDEGRVTYASPAVRSMLGYTADELTGSSFLTLVHPLDREPTARAMQFLSVGTSTTGSLSCRLLRPDGTWCQAEAMLSPLREGLARSVVLNIRDITERAALEEQLRHEAMHDVLTTLGNRRLFHERVRHALDRATRTGEDLAILYIDLDNFKRLNDSAGHVAGDEVLVTVADRLDESLRPADTAARLGGDEFGVLLEATGLEEAATVAQRVLTCLAAAHRTRGREVVLGASVGIAGCRGGTLDYDTLLRNADLAMYEAKASGRGRYAVFDPDMHVRLLRQVELESALRETIAHRGLDLHYQPIINLWTGRIVSVEALTRWSRPGVGAVPPSLFIPLAEERDLIQPLDRWVLDTACLQVAAWQQRYPQHAALGANINLSALELRDGGYTDAVTHALTRSGLAAHHLTLEVTETAVLPQQAASLCQLTALRDLGVRISLDDFGTGYSSLAILGRLPLDEIKIDRSFVTEVQDGQRGRGIVKAIIELAQALEVHTIAEGIEHPEQLTMLRALNCVSGQGYLLARPVPPQTLELALQPAA